MMLILLACVPHVADSSEDSKTSNTEPPIAGQTLFIATTDYSVGMLASLDLATDTLSDGLLATGGDPALSKGDDWLFLMERSTENTLRAYGSDLSAPVLEFATGDGSNPQEAVLCGEKIFVSLYEENFLAIYDQTGQSTGQVDLSAFDDGDGEPEASKLYVAPDGFLYVGMNHLDENYRAVGAGGIAKVDCETGMVLQSWEGPPNLHFNVDPIEPEVLHLAGGNYFLPDWSGPDLDGFYQRLDTRTGSLSEPLLTEADWGANLGFVVEREETTWVISDDGYAWEVWCVASDGTPTLALDGNLFVADTLMTEDTLYLAVRPGFGTGSAVSGIIPLDLATCHAGDAFSTALPPSSLALR